MKLPTRSMIVLSSLQFITMVCALSVIVKMYKQQIGLFQDYEYRIQMEETDSVSEENMIQILDKANEVFYIPERGNVAYSAKKDISEETVFIRPGCAYNSLIVNGAIDLNGHSYPVSDQMNFPAGTDIIIETEAVEPSYGMYYIKGSFDFTELYKQYPESIQNLKKEQNLFSFIQKTITERKEGRTIVTALIISMISVGLFFYLQMLKNKKEIQIAMMSGSRSKDVILKCFKQIMYCEPAAVIAGVLAAMEFQYIAYIDFEVIASAWVIHIVTISVLMLIAWLIFQYKTRRAMSI